MNRNLLLLFCLFIVQTSFIHAQIERTAEQIGVSDLQQTLLTAGNDRSSSVNIQLPDEDGQMLTYEAWESNFLSPELASKRPDYHSYILVGVDNPLDRGRIAISNFGIDAVILTQTGMLGIHPKDGIGSPNYEIYRGTKELEEIDQVTEHNFCDGSERGDGDYEQPPNKERAFNLSNGSTLRTYDLAIVTTGEFHDANGGTVPAAETVVMNTVNAIQTIYENELAVHFNLQTPHIYTDHETDPFEPLLNRTFEAAEAVHDNFSVNEYDIGHVFHDTNEDPAELPGGGVATINAVCDESGNPGGDGYIKARGWSGSFDNTINSWYQLASHEFGHMFGALHTFNGDGNACTGNISPDDSYEIGSGTTIMSYNGICGPGQNIPSSGVLDNYFHVNSMEEMIDFMNSSATCSTDSSSGNTAPTVDADSCGGTHTIPVSTPFELRGHATDPDGDALTYSWEQYDEDGSGTPTQGKIGSAAASDPDAPLFRSYPPSGDPVRTFPAEDLLLNNEYASSFEPLSTVARTMHFRLTVRDNHPGAGGIAINDVTVDVSSDGPLEVTAPNGGETWSAGSSQSVTWNVNNTDNFCDSVNIVLSVDGGATYPYTLAKSTANDGNEMINIPNGVADTDQARMRVECATDQCVVFFDISNDNFEITSDCEVITSHLCPDSAHTYPEGDPGLDLNVSGIVGQKLTGDQKEFSVNSGSPTYDVVSDDSTGGCHNYGLTNKYDTLKFTVTESGIYQFTIENFGGGPDFRIANLFENSFDPNNPCNTWMASNAEKSGNGIGGFSTFSDTLDQCQSYFLSLSRFSGSGDFTNNITFTGPGDIIEIKDLPTNYSYTYAAADASSTVISQVDTGADFTSLPDGDYSVYGIMYKSGGSTPPANINPANLVGERIDTLPGAGQCLLYSSNFVSLTVTDTGGCDANYVYGGVQSMPSAPFDTVSYCSNQPDPTPTIFGDMGGAFSAMPGGLSINSSTGTVDLSASSEGAYTVTYTVTGGGGCSESLVLEIETAPDAGINDDTTLCATDTPTDLFAVLDGTPETTGSWSGPSMLDNGHLGTYDPGSDDSGIYTYTVSGTICSDATATVDVTENMPADAGTPVSPFPICETNSSVDLFTGLTGEDSGGTWFDDDNTGALTGNIFDATQVSPGTYDFTYVVMTVACPNDSTTLTVTVDPDNEAGTATGLDVCETNNSVNLFDGLMGEDEGGSWNDDDATGALTDSIFDATQVSPGDYDFTYSVTGGSCPSDQVTLTVSVDKEPEAGTASPLNVCVTETTVNLFTGLSGHDSGGTWNDDDNTGALTDSLFDASAAGPGTYDFTYLVTSVACPDDSVTLSVTVDPEHEAGTASAQSVCATNSSFNLFDGLSGYDSGGTWNDDDATGALTDSIFDATQVSPGDYDFTYTVSGGSCPSDQVTLTVSVNELPEAGTPTDQTICETDTSYNLFNALSGYDSDGTWSDDDGSGALTDSIFNASVAGPGTFDFTYTVSSEACPDDAATVTITVDEDLDAGTGGPITVCETNNTVELFAGLTGEDSGGTWFDDDNTAALNGSTFDATIPGPGTYDFTYVVSAGVCPDDSTTLTVTVEELPEAGTGSLLTVCETNNSVNLFDGLSGHDPGGIWIDDDNTGALSGSTFDASAAGPGMYDFTYIVPSMTCGNDSTGVTVTVEDAPDAGISDSTTICETGSPIDLYDKLGGSPDTTGSWSGPSMLDNGYVGTYDPVLDDPGVYTYTVTGGACSSSTATVTVEESLFLDAGTAQSPFTVCGSSSSVNLNSGLNGEDPGGSWSDDDNTGALTGNIFDATQVNPGDYDFTYTVNTQGCPADSTTLTVTVEDPPSAGMGDSVTVCETGSPIDLYNELANMPDTGGSWSGPSMLDNGYLGTYDPTTDDPGSYVYVVSGNVCPDDSATIALNESAAPDAGSAVSPFVRCETNSSVDLNNGLNGADSGGTWNDDEGTGALTGNIFDATQVVPGDYDFTYVVSAIGCPADSTTLTVTVEDAPDAGGSDTVMICSDGAPLDLFDELNGTPDAGGTWSGPSMLDNGDQGTYDPTSDDPGTYTYTVSGTACSNATADVEVIENTCQDTVSISGSIATNNGTSTGPVHVSWTGGANGSTDTDGSGDYSFEVSSGMDLTITPERDTMHDQYLSTFDLVNLQLHILGILTLNPYQIIAGDANNSQSLSTVDLVEIQLVLVGLKDTFSFTESWRFVPENYDFPDSLDPWDPPFPEHIDLTDVDGDTTGLDFVAIKVGDVNDVNAYNLQQSPPVLDRSDPYTFSAEVNALRAGEETVIWFEAGETPSMWGYQMSLEYDQSAMELEEIVRPEASEGMEEIHTYLRSDGTFISNYFKGLGQSVERPKRVFGWRVKAKRNISGFDWKEILRISDQPLRSEAYLSMSQRNAIDLELRIRDDKQPGFVLYPNRPNPFAEETVLSFDLPRKAEVQLHIMDASGRIVTERSVEGIKGHNKIEIEEANLPEGVLYYRISTDEHSAVRKMVLQR